MNCKPGDVAWITGLQRGFEELNGRVVKLKDQPFFYDPVAGGRPMWKLEDPQNFTLGPNAVDLSPSAPVGSRWTLSTMPDEYLRPFRDQPGQDETLKWKDVPEPIIELRLAGML